jgi:uncharacterized protein (TIGR02186 family)
MGWRGKVLVYVAMTAAAVTVAVAQNSPNPSPANPSSELPPSAQRAAATTATAQLPPKPVTTYRLETDVSMRAIPIDVRFSGARVVMFGSATSIGPAPVDAGPIDVVAIIQGAPSRLTVRRKSRVWGLWLNTRSLDFDQAPRYYAVVSTRPLEGIAKTTVLAEYGIGFEQVPITATLADVSGVSAIQLDEFRDAAIHIGIRQRQYVRHDGGIAFVGKSLFRGQIDLPATVPVGQLDVSMFLFRGGQVVARHENRVTLARQGFENLTYEFAHRHSLLYGLATVALATLVGLASSYIVSLRRR